MSVVLLLFFGLATFYNVSNPLFEAPDEIWHYFYAKHVRETGSLPAQSPTRTKLFSQQEAAQPPLYYVAGAALTAWISGRPPEEWVRHNQSANVGGPASENNKNVFVHGSNEDFPYSGDILAAHLLRLLSTLFGAGVVLFTYLLAREIWPERPDLAVGAAAFNAFIPQFVYMSAAISNDVPTAFFASASLWLAVRLVRLRRAAPWQVALLGALGAATILTKASGIAVMAVIVTALAIIAMRRGGVTFALWSLPLAVMTTGLLTYWWFARNLSLYGELVPLKALSGEGLLGQNATWADLWRDFAGLRASFWALFGWFDVPVDRWLYTGFDSLTLLALTGLLVFAIRTRRSGTLWRAGLGLSLLWLALEAVALLQYRMIVLGFQGRLLFPAISSISLLLFTGLSGLLPRRLMPALPATLGAAFFALTLLVPFWYIVPEYARPAPLAGEITEPGFKALPAGIGTGIALLGYRLEPESARAGETIEVTLFWKAIDRMDKDYTVFAQIINQQGQLASQHDSFPGGGNNATSLWSPGEVFRDSYRLRVPPDMPAPSRARVIAGFYLYQTMERLPVRFADGGTGDAIEIDQLAVVTSDGANR